MEKVEELGDMKENFYNLNIKKRLKELHKICKTYETRCDILLLKIKNDSSQ